MVRAGPGSRSLYLRYTPRQVGVGIQVTIVVVIGVVKVAVAQSSVPTQASASPHPAAAVDVLVGFVGGSMRTYRLEQWKERGREALKSAF